MTLFPGFKFGGHIVEENPPNTYCVAVSHFAQGKTKIQEQNSANSSIELKGEIKVDAVVIEGGVGGSASKKEDQSKKSSFNVDTDGEFIDVDISGGKDTCCCFGETNWVKILIKLEPTGISNAETELRLVQIREAEARISLNDDWQLTSWDLGKSIKLSRNKTQQEIINRIATELLRIQTTETDIRNDSFNSETAKRSSIKLEAESENNSIKHALLSRLVQQQAILALENEGRNLTTQSQQYEFDRIRSSNQLDMERLTLESKARFELQRKLFQENELRNRNACILTEQNEYILLNANIKNALLKLKQEEIEVNNLAFGAQDWHDYFGDVGVIPHLPRDIRQRLNGPCPFWPKKKIKDTHTLVLIPSTINGTPLTLNSLKGFVTNPRKSTLPFKYGYMWPDAMTRFGQVPAQPSHWVLMTKDVIPNTRRLLHNTQLSLIKNIDSNYEAPSLLDAVVAIFMGSIKTGEYLYRNDPSTYTACQENVGNFHLAVGAISDSGLNIGSQSLPDEKIGMSALLKL
ncbi:MAG TPA: hypothetical protein VLE96_04250 [Chlamydiales bacterium]|nr:hypothetical protein [Chlamydiales bacterium]